jgi:Inorganic Pyrophosphatase
MTDHEKKALKKVGISLGLTLGTMVASGGTSIFAHGVGSFFHHLGVHFVEHAFLETAGLAAVFAKGQQDEIGNGEHFEISDEEAAHNKSADNDIQMLIHQFIDYIENGDWSDLPDQINAESDDDDDPDPKKPTPKKSSNDKLKKALEIIDGVDLVKATTLSDVYKPFTQTIQKALSTPNKEEKFKLQGEIKYQGLTIKVENRKGSVRKGTDPDGKPWTTKMIYPYGYISRTKAADDEHVDCYVGDSRESEKVFVVHQNFPDTGKYDEDKVMLGFDDAKSAKQAYLQHYNSNKFFGSMTEMTFERFKQSLKENHGKKLEKAVLAVRVEQSRALTIIDGFVIDLFKGGKKAAIGEIRKFGGREYVKTADGWKFHGKGGGKKAQEHVESSGAEQTHESKAHKAFATVYPAKSCTDVSDCEINIQHVNKLLQYADKHQLSDSLINKLQVRLSQLSKRKEQFEGKDSEKTDKGKSETQKQSTTPKQWMNDNNIFTINESVVQKALDIVGDYETITGDKKSFYQKVNKSLKSLSTQDLSDVLSVRSQYKFGISMLGNWDEKLPITQAIEDILQDLPNGFTKNNYLFDAIEAISEGQDVFYARHNKGNIELSAELLDNSREIDSKRAKSFKEVLVHELGHIVSVKTGGTTQYEFKDGEQVISKKASGDYKEFAELCGWKGDNIDQYYSDPKTPVSREGNVKLITDYAETAAKEAFAEYFSAYWNNKKVIDKAIKENAVGTQIDYSSGQLNDARPLTELDLKLFTKLKQFVFDNEKLTKAFESMDLQSAVNIIEDILEKGGKRAVLGEIRKFGGRDYIKTADGWKFHGKGTGAKAQSHVQGTKQPKQENTTLNLDKIIEKTQQELDEKGVKDGHIYKDYDAKSVSTAKTPEQLRKQFGSPILIKHITGKESVSLPDKVQQALRDYGKSSIDELMNNQKAQTMSVDDLTFSQKYVFEKPLKNSKEKAAFVIAFDGKNYAIDGNHYIANSLLNKNSKVSIKLLNLNDKGEIV